MAGPHKNDDDLGMVFTWRSTRLLHSKKGPGGFCVSAFAAGTMFRFPLRTQRQANYSELSTETWSVDQIAAVFQQFQAPFWKPKRGWFVPAVRGCGSQTGGMWVDAPLPEICNLVEEVKLTKSHQDEQCYNHPIGESRNPYKPTSNQYNRMIEGFFSTLLRWNQSSLLCLKKPHELSMQSCKSRSSH